MKVEKHTKHTQIWVILTSLDSTNHEVFLGIFLAFYKKNYILNFEKTVQTDQTAR